MKVPQVQYVDRMQDVPVVKHVEAPQIHTTQKRVQVPQIRYMDRAVDVPVVRHVEVSFSYPRLTYPVTHPRLTYPVTLHHQHSILRLG